MNDESKNALTKAVSLNPIVATKEETELYCINLYGPVAKVFLNWRDSLEKTETPVTLRALDKMMHLYKNNEKDTFVFPGLAPDVDAAHFETLNKKLSEFKLNKDVVTEKIQKIQETHLNTDSNGKKPKNG